jgi:hypothetical protein
VSSLKLGYLNTVLASLNACFAAGGNQISTAVTVFCGLMAISFFADHIAKAVKNNKQ